jgi:hypothetical protein
MTQPTKSGSIVTQKMMPNPVCDLRRPRQELGVVCEVREFMGLPCVYVLCYDTPQSSGRQPIAFNVRYYPQSFTSPMVDTAR